SLHVVGVLHQQPETTGYWHLHRLLAVIILLYQKTLPVMYTVFDEKEEKYIQVAEPDPSLSYTYADYLQWRFVERLELLRGKIFRMSGPGTRHQKISVKLTTWFYNFLHHQPCQVFSAPFDVRLPVRNRLRDDQITTVVQPDISVICDENKLDERGCCG